MRADAKRSLKRDEGKKREREKKTKGLKKSGKEEEEEKKKRWKFIAKIQIQI